MAESAQQQLVEIDPDFEPFSRPRSCTWPLPRPEFINPANSSASSPAPSIKQEPSGNDNFINNLRLLEETEDYVDEKPPLLCNDFQCQENCIHKQTQQHQQQQHPNSQLPHQQQVALLSSPVGSAASVAAAAAAAQRKTSSSRRNAWGNMSYADLITKAIESSPEKRLTLSQIYDWMVKSVPYFMDKGDSNSSAGWKNSIRHNLSLHSRFVRVQNEGTGKSSWWMLNPEGGKSGKSPRRRAASMDNNSKFAKSRGRAAKKKVSLQAGSEGGAESPGSQYSRWPGSPSSHSNDDFEAWSGFRPRTGSNASTLSGRLSPFVPEQDDLGEGDVHLVYSGVPGSKMAATAPQLPSLSEVTGSLGRHSSEGMMDSLLDNFNLLSPKGSQVGPGGSGGSSQSSPSAMMQTNPGYPSYSSPGMTSQPQQDFRKCLYGQVGLGGLSTMPMQALPEGKPSFCHPLSQYNCQPGLLKELLISDSDGHGELMPTGETVVTHANAGMGLLPPPYGSSQSGHGVEMMGRAGSRPHPHSPRPHAMQCQAPGPTSATMNGRHLLPLTPLNHDRGPGRPSPEPLTLQPAFGPSVYRGYCSLNGGGPYGRPIPPQPHHPEKLPSDLDDMSIERFECDMESILHDTLMDGDSLDFNFDPAVAPQGFPHSTKTASHSWVSG